MLQEIYFDGKMIFTFERPIYHSKMWVFRDVRAIEPFETEFQFLTL